MARGIRAVHILVAPQREAASIEERVAAGENFGRIAKKYPRCSSKRERGDLHRVRPGMMVEPFSEAVFAGKKGDVVGPVKTEFDGV